MQLCKGNEEIQTQHSSGAPGATAAARRPPPASRLPGKQKWFGPQGGAPFAKVLIMKQS